MKIIPAELIEQTVFELFSEACIKPDDSVERELEAAEKKERTPHAKEILRQLIINNRIAANKSIPACQDTGMAVVLLELGQDVSIRGGFLDDAINRGVARAYEDGYFRKSVLDPLTRENTGDNTPAVIHTKIVRGDELKITCVPKGFGSENMSAIAMLAPSAGERGVIDFIVSTAVNAGGSPCPPVILGVGIGGTFESCAMLAKEQLLRPLNKPSEDPELAEMEKECKRLINELDLGPMGLGGDTYCLAVHIAKTPTHIAALPVAVNYCCHMLRFASATL